MNTLTTTIDATSLAAYVAARSTAVNLRSRLVTDERGEGVISAAIVVLIMAFLGAAMWVGFKAIFDDASKQTGDQVGKIGK